MTVVTSHRQSRFASLARGETKILVRNRTAMFTALALPPFLAFAVSGISPAGADGIGGFVTTALLASGLVFIVYLTLVTSLVARREQFVLKRLRTGEATALQILLAPAVPLWGLLLALTGLGIGAGVAVLGISPVHAWAIVPAVVLGAAAWTGVAIWTAALTRTVESAQLTTMPLIFVALFLSGLSLPLSILPGNFESVAHLLPLTPVVDLLNLAFAGPAPGTTALETTIRATLVLVAWAAFGFCEGLRAFRWEPRI